MKKREFQAESKRMLDLMINSIYTNKEIFLRELISNASDAIDKYYYKSLKDDSIKFDKDDFFIMIERDEENRQLIISDTGIGMTKEELDENLGTIAKSGSLEFKTNDDVKEQDAVDIIGQFGVGFYSAFMVAEKITVISKAYGSDEAYKWQSSGVDGYTIEKTEKDEVGTVIILDLKENDEDDNYDDYLSEYTIRNLITKYSDFIRYPIKMEVTKTKLKDGSDDEYEEYNEVETLNTMVPIWRKNKNELTEDDYNNFYRDKGFGLDTPLRTIHFNVDGMMSYRALMYIPKELPFNFYTQEFEKGLELYSSGVLIMDKCQELLPDYFSFVKGVVDSEDLSLNISREMLQNDRQLNLIAKRLETKIKEELEDTLENDREAYEGFFKNFGRQLKFGAYDNYGINKDTLEDLLLFYSSKDKELVTLKEYVDRMDDEEKYIYYATGESLDRIDRMPQIEVFKDKDIEVLYLDDEVDEFALMIMQEYDGKEFKSIYSEDVEIEESEDKKDKEKIIEDNKDMFDEMKNILDDRVVKIKPSSRLKNHPVCFSTEGDISIEMEKTLNAIPNNPEVKAEKVLELNTSHPVFDKLKKVFTEDKEEFKLYTNILYDQASLIEGLEIEDPIKFAENIAKIM